MEDEAWQACLMSQSGSRAQGQQQLCPLVSAHAQVPMDGAGRAAPRPQCCPERRNTCRRSAAVGLGKHHVFVGKAWEVKPT